MTLPYAEPYKIKMTEAIRTSTRASILKQKKTIRCLCR